MKAMTGAKWLKWCAMLLMIMLALPALATANNKVFPTVTFELNRGISGYSNFLTRLRNQVEDSTRTCGLQSTREKPLKDKEYVQVKLQISEKQFVTLGLDAKDLYVWGYSDNVKYNGKCRATFLNDTPPEAKTALFPDVANSEKTVTRFGGNYNSLERATQGQTRENIVLGISNLDNAIRNVYGKSESQLNTGPNEARFFLIAIQMVAEAARFSFMERAIAANDNSQTTKRKMVDFQNDWDVISQAFHNAEAAKPKCTRFSPPLQIGNTLYQVVDAVRNDMGILKYKRTRLSILSSTMDDDDPMEILESAFNYVITN